MNIYRLGRGQGEAAPPLNTDGHSLAKSLLNSFVFSDEDAAWSDLRVC